MNPLRRLLRTPLSHLALALGPWLLPAGPASAATWTENPSWNGCATSSRMAGFVHADGIESVVGTLGGQLLDVNLGDTGLAWTTYGYQPADAAMGYVRSDGVSAIVFGSPLDGDIHELQVWGFTFTASDLSVLAATGARRLPGAAPWGYVRSDAVSAVVYVADDFHVHELARVKGAWHDADLTAVVGDWGTTWAKPYVRADGLSAVVQTGADGAVWEMELVAGHWRLSPIGALGGELLHASAPMGYARADGTTGVVYLTPDSHVHELRLAPSRLGGSTWTDRDLSALVGRASDGSPPWAYVNGLGQSAVVYTDPFSHHVHEMAEVAGHWTDTDLAVAAGDPARTGPPAGSTAFVDAAHRSRVAGCWQSPGERNGFVGVYTR